MATINKKLIHFRSLSDFEARLAAGDVLSTSIVWIKDAKKIWTHGTYYDCNGGETLTEADILSMGFTKNAGTITGVSANGTSVATSGVANIPAASTSKYGVTKLSSATNSSSTSLAATPSAVKAAYDLAKGKQDKLTSGTNIKTVNGQSLLGSGDITISGGSGGSSSYVPMPETFVEQGATLEHTLSPNTSLYAFLVGAGRVYIDLQEPTSFDVVNEYTMIFRTFGMGNAITINKTIFWANGKSPVLSDSANEIIEISVKCINAPMYDGIQYLGTWAKYETISTDPT